MRRMFHDMRPSVLVALLLPTALAAQGPLPRFLYIYRDSLKAGADSAYRAIENDGAQVCVDLQCPNPYFAIESVNGSHEVWWINAFDTEKDTTRVANAYAADHRLTEALAGIAARKQPLIGRPTQGFATYRGGMSASPRWTIVGARYVVIEVTRRHPSLRGSAWEMTDSTLYVFRAARTRPQAEALARGRQARVFTVRPNWSMPAPEWIRADPEFWRGAPSPHK